jgi:hypothetical protein
VKTFARIQDNRVVEFIATGADIATMFHPSLVWVDVSGVARVEAGWSFDGSAFTQPSDRENQDEAAPPLSRVSPRSDPSQ